MGDSLVANGLMRKCYDSIGRYKIVVDQGFRRTKNMQGIFVGPISQRTLLKIRPRELRLSLMRQTHRYVSLRQAVEWGMRALQATYTRLKSVLTQDHNRRRLLLHGIFLMHNYRTNLIGINQIRTVFEPEYERIVQYGAYDRIRRFFARP
jgi:hypothetical protein